MLSFTTSKISSTKRVSVCESESGAGGNELKEGEWVEGGVRLNNGSKFPARKSEGRSGVRNVIC